MRWQEQGQDPDYRFSLANERTFLAWIRTALALLAGGTAVSTVLPNLGPAWFSTVLALGLLGLSLTVALLSYRRWQRTEIALRTGGPLPTPQLMRVLSAGIVVLVILVALAAVI